MTVAPCIPSVGGWRSEGEIRNGGNGVLEWGRNWEWSGGREVRSFLQGLREFGGSGCFWDSRRRMSRVAIRRQAFWAGDAVPMTGRSISLASAVLPSAKSASARRSATMGGGAIGQFGLTLPGTENAAWGLPTTKSARSKVERRAVAVSAAIASPACRRDRGLPFDGRFYAQA